MKRLVLFVLLGGIVFMGGCTGTNSPDGGKNPVATIEMENGGQIVLELYYDKAPETVKNFIALAQNGFYNGTGFHRIMPGFMIQGGDPNGDGTGGPGYTIKGEFAKNGVDTGLSHVRGIVSMARRGDPSGIDELDKAYYDTAGSQFFIVVSDSEFLDEKYGAFGEVLEGMDIVDRIVQGKASGDRAIEPELIKSVTVDTFGKTYSEPERLSK